jgi:hypothetical protein
MIIASIDVGIKNCSICIFDVQSKCEYDVKIWKNISFVDDIPTMKCSGKLKKGNICGKNASLEYKDLFFCNLHAKSCEYKMPDSKLYKKNISKKKIDELKEISKCIPIHFNDKMKKSEIITQINEYVNNNYLQKIEKSKTQKFNLLSVGRNLVSKLDTILSELAQPIDILIIENQIGPLAIKMKTLQGMISQYFIMRIENIQIESISSINKLKEFNKSSDKLTYKERKSKSIDICRKYLENKSENLDFFNQNKKKDDLADSFLQGIWFIQNKIYNSS